MAKRGAGGTGKGGAGPRSAKQKESFAKLSKDQKGAYRTKSSAAKGRRVNI